MKKLITCSFLLSIQLFAGIGVGESPITPLPVELTSFTAEAIGSNVVLYWVTATEIRNYGFEVERASSSTTPIQGWEKIGFINGHGSSNSLKHYSFTDSDLSQSGHYSYRLKQIDTDGKFSYSNIATVYINPIPDAFVLYQNFPNPFNPSTMLQYSIPISTHVLLTVFDVLGNCIKTIVNESQEAGSYEIIFNAGELSNGMYFYKIQAGDFVATNKMLLIK